MRQLVLETERAWQSLGRISYGASEAEKKSMVFRRSLYVVKDMQAGETFSAENVRAIRPGFGLPPKYLETVIGKHARTALKRGTALSWDIIS